MTRRAREAHGGHGSAAEATAMSDTQTPAPAPASQPVAHRVERAIESTLFVSRWLLAPIYLGLIVSLFALLAVFAKELWHTLGLAFSARAKTDDIILLILSMIDISLAANLVLIVVYSGYENFVSRLENDNHPDRPEWLGKIDFGGLKLKLIASIAAISAIQLLKQFVNMGEIDNTKIYWLVVIHVVFVISGLVLAIMDYVSAKAKQLGYAGD
jgi:uncharacterized protein (TIGR00645 family)